METKNILILDTSEQMRKTMVEHFEGSTKYNVVGDFDDLEIALDYIKNNKVDLVISDLVFSKLDGLSFLEKLKELDQKTPKVIILSSLYEETIVNQALQLGVSYYMLKPVDFNMLERRADMLTAIEDKPVKATIKNKALEEKITNIFLTVGIPAHIKGYQFLREAIKMAIDNPEIINSITKKLYPSIADRFDTSASKVERAIRHAIEVAWNRGKIENINTLFGIKVYNNNEKPTNGEFIALVADKMLIEGA